MKILFIFLFLPITLFSQKIEIEKSDTIIIDNLHYPTYFIKIDNYSASDPAKVFIGYLKDFDSLKRIIPECYFSRKQEYNEYYLLGVTEMTDTARLNKILIAYLNKIDSARMLRNRSTFLRSYSLINNDKISYQDIFKDLQDISNVFILRATNDLYRNMGCKLRR